MSCSSLPGQYPDHQCHWQQSSARRRELPVSIVLDDSSLLRPGTSLSQFEQLKLGARVSRSGQPVAQSGDLQSTVQVVKTSHQRKQFFYILINECLEISRCLA